MTLAKKITVIAILAALSIGISIPNVMAEPTYTVVVWQNENILNISCHGAVDLQLMGVQQINVDGQFFDVTQTNREIGVVHIPDDIKYGTHTFQCQYQNTNGIRIYSEILTLKLIEPLPTPEPTPEPEPTSEPTPVAEPETKKKKGGSTINPPPTLGVNKDGKRMVENGVILNGIPLNATYFHTQMDTQYTEIGQTNQLELKIYENSGSHNIEMVQFGLGVKEIGTPISESQALFEIEIANFSNDVDNPSIEDINLIDKDGLIEWYEISTGLESCGAIKSECLTVEIQWKYAAAPDYPVLMVNTYDRQRATFNDYFNDGLTVLVDEILVVEEKYEYKCNDKPLDEINVPTRNNCHFRALVSFWQ